MPPQHLTILSVVQHKASIYSRTDTRSWLHQLSCTIQHHTHSMQICARRLTQTLSRSARPALITQLRFTPTSSRLFHTSSIMSAKSHEKPIYRTHQYVPENVRTESIQELQTLLSSAIDLKYAIKTAHWNVRGPTFIVSQHHHFSQHAVDACPPLVHLLTNLSVTAFTTL